MTLRYLLMRISLSGRRGAETWGFGFLFLCLLIGGAYTMFPGTFHSFVHWVLNGVFDALNSSFGGNQTSPAGGPHPENLTTLPKGTSAP